MELLKSYLYSFRRILIAVFCCSIASIMTFVMLCVYNPNQNALRALSSVCMDLVCIIILFILIGSFAFENYGSKRTTRLFALLLVATIWALFLDFLNWAFDGSLEFGQLTFWFTVGSLCMGAILACIFSLYLYSYMDEAHNLSRMRGIAYTCVKFNLLSFAVSFFLAITGTAFQFVDGHYETGILYDIVTVTPVLSMLILTIYIVFCFKKVGLHDVFAVAGYILFIIAGSLIESIYVIGTTYVAVAIAVIFIFVMLQNELIAQERRKAQKWMQKSNTDELTGFYSRHAFVEEIENLENSRIDKNFVYISADVNSLKVVNDTLGHSAGDELIIGAAQCLEKSFGAYGKLYRTGGDEFIGLIYANEKELAKARNVLEETTKNWSGNLVDKLAISCGYVARIHEQAMTVRQMGILADQRMYEAKNEYYRKNGIERRRSKA